MDEASPTSKQGGEYLTLLARAVVALTANEGAVILVHAQRVTPKCVHVVVEKQRAIHAVIVIAEPGVLVAHRIIERERTVGEIISAENSIRTRQRSHPLVGLALSLLPEQSFVRFDQGSLGTVLGLLQAVHVHGRSLVVLLREGLAWVFCGWQRCFDSSKRQHVPRGES